MHAQPILTIAPRSSSNIRRLFLVVMCLAFWWTLFRESRDRNRTQARKTCFTQAICQGTLPCPSDAHGNQPTPLSRVKSTCRTCCAMGQFLMTRVSWRLDTFEMKDTLGTRDAGLCNTFCNASAALESRSMFSGSIHFLMHKPLSQRKERYHIAS